MQGVARQTVMTHRRKLLQALHVVLHDVAVVEAAQVRGGAVPALQRRGRLAAGAQTRLSSSTVECVSQALVLCCRQVQQQHAHEILVRDASAFTTQCRPGVKASDATHLVSTALLARLIAASSGSCNEEQWLQQRSVAGRHHTTK